MPHRGKYAYPKAGVFLKKYICKFLHEKYFSHLHFTGFSALQVAAGGLVDRQGLDLVHIW